MEGCRVAVRPCQSRRFCGFQHHQVGKYVRQMEAGFAKAVTAAAASPTDLDSWKPARSWAIEYRGWVASGAAQGVILATSLRRLSPGSALLPALGQLLARC